MAYMDRSHALAKVLETCTGILQVRARGQKALGLEFRRQLAVQLRVLAQKRGRRTGCPLR